MSGTEVRAGILEQGGAGGRCCWAELGRSGKESQWFPVKPQGTAGVGGYWVGAERDRHRNRERREECTWLWHCPADSGQCPTRACWRVGRRSITTFNISPGVISCGEAEWGLQKVRRVPVTEAGGMYSTRVQGTGKSNSGQSLTVEPRQVLSGGRWQQGLWQLWWFALSGRAWKGRWVLEGFKGKVECK
jgi:hypothetical protein